MGKKNRDEAPSYVLVARRADGSEEPVCDPRINLTKRGAELLRTAASVQMAHPGCELVVRPVEA